MATHRTPSAASIDTVFRHVGQAVFSEPLEGSITHVWKHAHKCIENEFKILHTYCIHI